MELSERSQVQSQHLNQHHLALYLIESIFKLSKTNLCYYFIAKLKVDYRLLFYQTKFWWI